MAPPRRITLRLLLFAIVGTALILGSVSLFKYWLYEREDRAPRLRQAIGKQVEIPWTRRVIAGMGLESGGRATLTYVGYRFNDKWGFFDLEVHWEGERSGIRGFSPAEAADIVVLGP